MGRSNLGWLQSIFHFSFAEYYNPENINFGVLRVNWDDRKNKWLHMVSNKDGDASIRINQDVNFYSLELDEGKEINFPVKEGRQAYLVQIEGNSTINNISLTARDGLEIVEEEILIQSKDISHILVIEMIKE